MDPALALRGETVSGASKQDRSESAGGVARGARECAAYVDVCADADAGGGAAAGPGGVGAVCDGCGCGGDTTAAMLNLYVDVQAKLRREFRNYGANIILVGKGGSSLPADALERVDSVLAGRGVAAPFSLVVARTSNGQAVVVRGDRL